LKKIPREYIRCEEGCPVAVQDQDKETNSFEALAHDFKTTPAILTKVNGRGDWEPESPKNMKTLLVPKPVPGN
jgi:hypothetical protein